MRAIDIKDVDKSDFYGLYYLHCKCHWKCKLNYIIINEKQTWTNPLQKLEIFGPI